MARKGTHRIYQFVDDLVTLGHRELMAEFGVPEDHSRDTMLKIAHAMCHHYARTTIHVPALIEIRLDERDERIYEAYQLDGPDGARAFTKDRLEQLAAQYELTLRHLYSVVALARRRDLARRQPTLPGLETDPA